MGVVDFVVNYDTDAKKMGSEVIRHLTVNRLKARKPVIILLVGDSGEGKSYTGLKIMDIVNNWYGVKTANHLEDQVVYTPLEYTKKMDAILHDKDKKKLKVLMIDEAREIVSSKLWYSFVNRAIADVNALHRTIKPIILIVVVQFIRDIDPSTRRTVQYYFKCARPLAGSVNLYPFRLWKDDKDIDNPRLRKRTLKGYYIKNKHKIPFRPRKFIITMPPKEIYQPYDVINRERKSKIIRRKLEALIKGIEKELGFSEKVEKLVNYYTEHPELLNLINKKTAKKITMKKDFKEMHDLTPIEVKEFEEQLFNKLKEAELTRE